MKEVNSNKSELHRTVLAMIKECFPQESIREEENIRIDGASLFIDIYMPRMKIAIECDGVQHEKFSKFFHGDAATFARSKKNDMLKERYCEIQKITLVRIKYNDTLSKDLVYNKIIDALKGK